MNNESPNDVDTVPDVKYFDKATDLIASYDRLLASLYSALIAGIVLLLIKEEVSLWVGAVLLAALVLFVLGMGHTLLHIAFHSKLLLLLESLMNGTTIVPNVVEHEEPTVDAYKRTQAWCQRAYGAQLLYLFFGICLGGVAVFIRLWGYASRMALLGIGFLLFLMTVGVLIATWKKTIRRYGRKTATQSRQEESSETKE
jgi:hypothetical protein